MSVNRFLRSICLCDKPPNGATGRQGDALHFFSPAHIFDYCVEIGYNTASAIMTKLAQICPQRGKSGADTQETAKQDQHHVGL